jgi:hypothetical protein
MPAKNAAGELFSLVHSFLVANDQAKSAKALKKGCDSEVPCLPAVIGPVSTIWNNGSLLPETLTPEATREQISEVEGADLLAIYDAHLAENG